MEIDLTTPTLLFSTVSLLLLAFTNRFLGLAKAIRDLYQDYQNNPQKRFLDQIKNLRRRVVLIRNMQIVGTASLLLCTVSMISVFAQVQAFASFTFAVSLLLMAAALFMSIVEIGMSVGALNVHLADMEQTLSANDVKGNGWSAIVRRLGRFSLTSMVWLCVVVALLVLWIRDHRQLEKLMKGPRVANSAWSVDQLLGAPNTSGLGDQPTAWASATPDDQPEWIPVEFDDEVTATKLEVYESFNSGAISRVSTVSALGTESVVWDSANNSDSAARMISANSMATTVALTTPVEARRFRIDLDSARFRGWNEIDAVGLVDEKGNIQWASAAWASSSFGLNHTRPSWFWP
ncbi:MAG: DUF2721 domain-containing protein [Pirellulales bacterium]